MSAPEQFRDRRAWPRVDRRSPIPRRRQVDAWPQAGEITRNELDEFPLEPLTPREQEVLGLLSALLTTEEIADRMFISVNTVRTHVRSVMRKLSVSRRNEAIRRARGLNLI